MGQSKQCMVDITELALISSLREHVKTLETASKSEGLLLAAFDDWISVQRNSIDAESIGVDCDHVKVEVAEEALYNCPQISTIVDHLVLNATEDAWKKWELQRSGDTGMTTTTSITTRQTPEKTPAKKAKIVIKSTQPVTLAKSDQTTLIETETKVKSEIVKEHLPIPDYKKAIDEALESFTNEAEEEEEEEDVVMEEEEIVEEVTEDAEVGETSTETEKDENSVKPKKRRRISPKVECKKCFLEFENLYERLAHEAVCKGECEFCGKCYTRKQRLKVHRQTHTRKDSLPSPDCDEEFNVKSDLVRNSREFQCNECGIYLSSSSSLRSHKRHTHRGIKPFVCEYCQKGFISRSHLNGHLTTHTKERNYACKHCNMLFTLQTNLNRHISIVHEKERKWICFLCQKSFQHQYLLKKHESNVHRIKDESSNERKLARKASLLRTAGDDEKIPALPGFQVEGGDNKQFYVEIQESKEGYRKLVPVLILGEDGTLKIVDQSEQVN